MKQTWQPELWLLSPPKAWQAIWGLKCVTDSWVFEKRKKGVLSIPEFPDQGDSFMKFSTSGGGWGWEALGSVIFFPLADFILVFQLSFPSTPRPQDSVTTLWGLSRFLCLGPLSASLGLPSAEAEVLSHGTSISLAVSGRSVRTALSSGHWQNWLLTDTGKVAPPPFFFAGSLP